MSESAEKVTVNIKRPSFRVSEIVNFQTRLFVKKGIPTETSPTKSFRKLAITATDNTPREELAEALEDLGITVLN